MCNCSPFVSVKDFFWRFVKCNSLSFCLGIFKDTCYIYIIFTQGTKSHVLTKLLYHQLELDGISHTKGMLTQHVISHTMPNITYIDQSYFNRQNITSYFTSQICIASGPVYVESTHQKKTSQPQKRAMDDQKPLYKSTPFEVKYTRH